MDRLAPSRVASVPTSFPVLDTMSISELEELAEDPLALDTFINNLDSVKESAKLRDQLLQTSTEQARKNLSRESEIKTLQDQNLLLRNQLQDQLAILQGNQQKQQAIAQKYSVKNLVALLSASIDQAEDDTAKLKKAFEVDENDEMEDEDVQKDGENGIKKPKKKN